MKHVTRILLALAPGYLAAQEAPVEGPAEGGDDARRYAVEVIIFRYDELVSVGTEVFVPERLEDETGIPVFGDPVADPAGDPTALTAVPSAAADEEPPAELRYRPLEPDEFTLEETRGRLERLQAYEPLMHFGWVQDTIPEAETPPLALERFGTPPPGLSGTLTLRLSRFLHLGVDLSLAADEAYVPPGGVPADDFPGPGQGAQASGTTPRYAPLRYEIAETRIIRSGETRYYDHPRFGVIARVTRAQEAEDPTGGR